MNDRYQSSIPDTATEVVTATHEGGAKAAAEYVLDDQVVGIRRWDEEGYLALETPLREGRTHGIEYTWDSEGTLTLAEPYKNGLVHGEARQWALGGTLLGTYTMDHGTGIDLWRHQNQDGSVVLAEVFYMKYGKRHGYEWWINADQETVSEERHWREWKLHGIERIWGFGGRLAEGYPKFYIRGEEVVLEAYLAACKVDESLPVFKEEEDHPHRDFPPEIIREMM